MKYPDIISSIFCLFLGLAVLTNGVRLRLKVGPEMGPGFFPFLAGGILTFLSILLLMQTLIRKRASGKKESFWIDQYGRKLVFLTLFGIVAYPLFLKYLGFLLSTFLLLFFLVAIIARQKWWTAGVVGATSAVVVYLIFELWLKANLPRGIMGF